ncbi:MAG: site-2 protease family protein, partial [Pseudomonadota bacterium]
ILIAILVFHEYGHLRAMRSFRLQTKGMYLIPFFGGVAVGERAKTYWAETYISMMGPFYGLAMSAAAWLGFWLTGSELLGLIASFSALINLFNLLPIYPLDGGHVLKATALSLNPRGSYVLLIALSAAGFAVSAYFGLYLLTLFIVLGALDLIASFKTFRENEVAPMDTYGMVVSMGWYVATLTAFVWIIMQMYAAGVPGAEVPYLILTE